MKKYKYVWGKDNYMLHIQIDGDNSNPCVINIRHVYNDFYKDEKVTIQDKYLRKLITKNYTDELYVVFNYPNEYRISLYEIKDNAFYPTIPVYEG